eukprot:COSAG06_NODE_2440_length_6872_cov_135.458586_4_plen_81_part_00
MFPHSGESFHEVIVSFEKENGRLPRQAQDRQKRRIGDEGGFISLSRRSEQGGDACGSSLRAVHGGERLHALRFDPAGLGR